MPETLTVRDLPPSERPRERLLKLGVEALSTQELLEVLLGRGIRGESVIVTAHRLLSRFKNIQGLSDASMEELCEINGIGTAKAAQIKAALEMGKRLHNHPAQEKKGPVKSAEDAVNLVRGDLAGKKKEHFLALHLDIRNRVIGMAKVSIGSLNSSIVHPREAFREAIAASAAAIIFVHNHPSGDVQPSDDDIEITKRLAKAGEI
ncbi:MAG: DNA repair protein RadC, partial [Dehalococcoidia bacterium]|nr:DNA repair protein RadC [Dehalococcoidia bacterium]